MPAADNRKPIPRAVVRRLTEYLAHVKHLRDRGVAWISSHELGEELGWTSSTVRQDLSHLRFSGISKRGYETGGLAKALADILGADTCWNVVVVGAGNLGRALVLHEDFLRNGFRICGIFDCDKRKIGSKIGSLVVQDIRELGKSVSRLKMDMGVLAVPASAAQEVADTLAAAGVKGLLNLALTHINLPADIAVVDSRIVASLQELAHTVKIRQQPS